MPNIVVCVTGTTHHNLFFSGKTNSKASTGITVTSPSRTHTFREMSLGNSFFRQIVLQSLMYMTFYHGIACAVSHKRAVRESVHMCVFFYLHQPSNPTCYKAEVGRTERMNVTYLHATESGNSFSQTFFVSLKVLHAFLIIKN